MKRTAFLCIGLLVSIVLFAADQQKLRIALVEFHEDVSGADRQWKPSDFRKRLVKALEKKGKFDLVEPEKVEKIEKSGKYFGRMSPDQEEKIKELKASHIVYFSVKRAKGEVTNRGSIALVVVGLTVLDLVRSKASDEFLVTGQSTGELQGGDPQDYMDSNYARRDEIERILEDAGRVAVEKAASRLVERDWS